MNTYKMFVRSITGLASTVLFAIYIAQVHEGQDSLTVEDLMGWVMVKDDDGVRQACESLVALDLISIRLGERGKKHYRLTDSAQQFLPGMMPILPAMPGALPNPVSEKSETGKRLIIDAEISVSEKSETGLENSDFRPENSEEDGQNPVLPESENEKTGSLINLINDDESNINFKKSSSSSMNPKIKKELVSESKQVTVFDTPQDFPSLDAILSAMEMLFGDYLTADMFPPGTSPKLALAWVCKAYFDYQTNPRFTNPVGLIRRRLAAKEPRKITRLEDMPDDFLDALGLWQGRCDLCGKGFRSRNALREHLATEKHSEGDADVEEPSENAGSHPENKSMVVDIAIFPEWQSVLNTMQERMPRAYFDSWMRDTAPVAWDHGTRRLQIGVRNSYARDWLEQRVQEDCAKLVGEIIGEPVELEFVVV